MIKLALTGSIGMGKSTVAAMFKSLGVPLFDADAAVHALYAPGGAAVPPMSEAFPDARTPEGGIDRAVLVRHVMADPAALKRIEAIVHPLVGQMREDFLQAAEARNDPLVLLDIPLLFEGRAKNPDSYDVQHVAVVSAPHHMQRARVLARPGMTEEKFAAILAKQVPDHHKRRMADTVIDTGVSHAETERQVAELVAMLREKAKNHA